MKFRTIFILVIITRILDGVTTYFATPNLQYEFNPIVHYFSMGWLGFIILGFGFTIVVLWISYSSFKHLKLFEFKANSLRNYISIFLYEKPNRLGDLMARPNKQRLIIFVGQVFPISLIYYSVFLIINNTFIIGTYHNELLYSVFLSIHLYHTLIITLVPFIIFTWVSYSYMKIKYETFAK